MSKITKEEALVWAKARATDETVLAGGPMTPPAERDRDLAREWLDDKGFVADEPDVESLAALLAAARAEERERYELMLKHGVTDDDVADYMTQFEPKP